MLKNLQDFNFVALGTIVVFQNYFMNSLKLVWFLFVCMCKDFLSGVNDCF